MSKYISDFYKSIVEASDRGKLWGVEKFQSDSKETAIFFDPSTYIN